MKVLWVINKPLPQVSEALKLRMELSQSWLLDLARAIQDAGIELCSVCVENVNDMRVVQIRGTNQYVMPFASKLKSANAYTKYWKIIMEKEKPDLIHVHGTEYKHPISLLESYPNVPSILTIQGLIKRISEQFFGGLSLLEVLKYRTVKENLHLSGMLFTKYQYKKQALIEKQIVGSVDCVTGRTMWDYSILKEMNPKITYHQCNYNLREAFYEAEKWNINTAKKHSIYTSFSSYPLKGLHMLLKAIAIVKQQYADILLTVPGVRGDEQGKIVSNTGYTKYIQKLISQHGIEDNVRFVGGQCTEDVIRNLQTANLCIVSSAIEGASATLREAMHIGTPCICSFRGGMTELLDDRVDGFYYDYSEYPYLAERIMQVFRDESMALSFSRKLIEKAEKMHDREQNTRKMLHIYEDVFKDERRT